MQLKLLMTNQYSTINSFLPVFSVANLFCFMLYCRDLQNMIEKSGVRVEKKSIHYNRVKRKCTYRKYI